MRTVTDEQLIKKFNQLKNGANERKVPFTITLNGLKKVMRQEFCYYTKVKFDPTNGQQNQSIERVDSDLGYSDDNIVACTTVVNQAKSNLTFIQLKMIVSAMEKFHLKKLKIKPKKIYKKSINK